MEGKSPMMPKSSEVRTMPAPKTSDQNRLTVTRAGSDAKGATQLMERTARVGGSTQTRKRIPIT